MKGKKTKDQKKPKKKVADKSDSNIMDYIGEEYSEITSKVKEYFVSSMYYYSGFFNGLFPISI